MLPLETLKDMKVMVATPCYASSCAMTYTGSMFKLAYECARYGIEIDLQMRSESQVVTSRNRFVAQFLLDDTLTHFFFIDGDVEFTPEAFARLLLADKDVVVGVYPLKKHDWPKDHQLPSMTRQEYETFCTPYPFNVIDEKLKSDSEGFAEVREATTGFMCIKRHVLLKMVEAYPNLRYFPDDDPGKDIEDNSYLFFNNLHEPESKRFLTEDYAFCHLWRKIGGKVFIDLHSKLNHLGQYNWKGDLYSALKMGGVRQLA